MAPTFGRFLKAGRSNEHIPNKRQTRVGPYGIKAEECLYNPKLHSKMINSTYELFKRCGTYVNHIDEVAQQGRDLCQSVMKIRDVAQTHTKPYISSVQSKNDDD